MNHSFELCAVHIVLVVLCCVLCKMDTKLWDGTRKAAPIFMTSTA